jgi:hypothetical protein
MWRFLAGALAAMLLMTGGFLIWGPGSARPPAQVPPPPPPSAAASEPLPERVPEATPKTREEKRFDRYDKDRNGAITREEYLASRRKAYAKLDANGDGRLSFEEWATKTATKFSGADRDRSGAMSRVEFATTAVKRKPRAPCPPAASDDG